MHLEVMMIIDSFSGSASELKKGSRTPEHILAALAKDPKVSTWDMSENAWLWTGILNLKGRRLIVELDEPYPWHRYKLTDEGKALVPNG